MKKTALLLSLLLSSLGGFSQTVVERHGQLSVSGAAIKDKCGRTAQLKGMSYFWHQWDGKEYWNADVIKWLRDDWKVEIMRAAVGARGGDDQYDYINNPTYATAQAKKVVDGAIQHGIYVIIDFHAHPNYKTQAKTFFAEMSKSYGNSPNVIYEIWNEPIGEYSNPGAMWTEIKEYSRDVIATIRANDPDGLIVVGTPFYDQFVNTAADSPLTTDINGKAVGNVAYTLHVYADAHRIDGYVGTNAKYALSKGLPMFVTESGATGTDYDQPRATGKNAPNYTEWKKWEDWWDANGISYTKWSMSTKDEFGSSLLPGAPVTGNWNYTTHLTDEGRWNRDHFRAVNALPAACATAADDIITATSPASVSPGQQLNVSVSYAATTARDIRVILQTETSPYIDYGSGVVSVAAGSGTVNVPIKVSSIIPLASQVYQFQTYLTTAGGGWDARLDYLLKRDVSAVAAATTTATNIYTEGFGGDWADWSWNGTATPADPLAKTGSKAFKFNFNANGAASFRSTGGVSGDKLVSLEFWARTYTGTASVSISGSYDDDFAHKSAGKSISVGPTYTKYTITKAELGNFGWYKRLYAQAPAGTSVFFDDIKLNYSTTASRMAGSSEALGEDQATTARESELALSNQLGVYPNPGEGRFVLTLPATAVPESRGLRVALYNEMGRAVLTRALPVPANGTQAELDVRGAGLPAGLYRLRLHNEAGQLLGVAPLVVR
jgi:Cellulase (glycosyl hydrolase family 5)